MRYSYRLSNRIAVYDKEAESVINDCIDRKMFAGDFWAAWNDEHSIGNIKVQLRSVNLKIMLHELSSIEFCHFVGLLSGCIPDVSESQVNDFYQKLLELELNKVVAK